MLGRAYSEFTQHFPQPGWVEHDAEEIWTVTRSVARAALEARSGRRGAGHRHHQPAGDGRGLGSRDPGARPSGHRLAGPAHDVHLPGLEGGRTRERRSAGGPGWSSTRTSRAPSSLGCSGERPTSGRGPRPESSRWAPSTAGSIARLTEGAVHATDPTNASRTLLYDLREHRWDPWAPRPARGPGFDAPGGPSERRRRSVSRSENTSGSKCPIAGVAGDQQAALFGQGCWHAGDGEEHLRNGGVPAPAHRTGTGPLATRIAHDGGVRRAGRCRVRPGRVGLRRRCRRAVAPGRSRAAGSRRRVRGAREVARGQRRSLLRARVRRARRPSLGARRAGDHRRPDPEARRRAHLVRAALEAMAYSVAEVLEAMEADSGVVAPELRVDGGAATNDWLMEFQADVLGPAGAADRHGGDHGARRRGPRGDRRPGSGPMPGPSWSPRRSRPASRPIFLPPTAATRSPSGVARYGPRSGGPTTCRPEVSWRCGLPGSEGPLGEYQDDDGASGPSGTRRRGFPGLVGPGAEPLEFRRTLKFEPLGR